MQVESRKLMVTILATVLVVASVVIVVGSGALKGQAHSVNLTDAGGNEIVMTEAPTRIVSCAPAITEIVCALGLEDKLVAVTDYDDYPEAAKALKDEGNTVGGFWDPNFEKIISYDPDLILLNIGTEAHPDLAKQLRDAGYNAVLLYAQEDLEEVYKSITLVGKLTDKTSAASTIVSEMKTKISVIGAKVSGQSTPSTLFISYVEPGFVNVWTTGSGTAIDEIIRLAGGKNTFADQDDWVNPSNEVLMSKASNIECIVMTPMYSGMTPEEITNYLKNDPIWQNSPAVKNNNLYYLTGQAENVFNRQSVRMVVAVQLMAEMLHPESFSTHVPHEADGVNIIGNEYMDYVTPGGETHTSSATILVAASCSRD